MPTLKLTPAEAAALERRPGVVVGKVALPAPTLREVVLDLPYPPSVNHYWRHWQGRVLVSKAGRAYRKAVLAVAALGCGGSVAGRLAVDLFVAPPDRRTRDLDNVCKAVLDALAHAGVYGDDGQIDELHVWRQGACRPGGVRVRVNVTRAELAAADATRVGAGEGA